MTRCHCPQIGIFNHVSYVDAFVCTWAFCAAGLTFEFTKHVPILGRGIRALQVRTWCMRDACVRGRCRCARDACVRVRSNA